MSKPFSVYLRDKAAVAYRISKESASCPAVPVVRVDIKKWLFMMLVVVLLSTQVTAVLGELSNV